jgi:hypothetical protein
MSSNLSIQHSLSFNQGLIPMDDDIRPVGKELPPQSKISPANLAYIAQVDQILEADGAQKLLRNWVRPELEKPDLLEPGVFSDVLQASLQSIKQEIKTATQDQAVRLKGAARVVEDHVQLRDYSLMMTMALYEG